MELPAEAVMKSCISIDASDTLSRFMQNGWPDAVRFDATLRSLLGPLTSASGYKRPIAAFGEMVALLWAEAKREAAIELERLWTDFLRLHSLSLLCAYPLKYFSREEDRALFLRVCQEHSAVTPAETPLALVSEDEQAREIAELQQRAEALAQEVEARKLAEEELRTTQAELESLVEQRTTALRRLSLQVIKLQDAERRRIARELHDSMGQHFVGLKVNLDLARKSPGDSALWRDCEQLLDNCISEVRTLSYLLHPPIIEDAGFASAAEWYIQDFARRSGLEVTFSGADDLGELSDAIKLVLFRVLQESLMNAHRHAHATSVSVNCWREQDRVLLQIQDDGVGIPPEKLARFNHNGSGMGVGLTGIWERVRDVGGEAALINAGKGMTIRISVPASEP